MSIVPPIISAVRPTSAEEIGVEKLSWRQELKQAVRDPAELCRLLHLPPQIAEQACAAAEEFPLVVPRGFVARMKPGDPHDPLLRQVLPLDEELRPQAGFSQDAVADQAAELVPGLLKKYAGRALVVSTGTCAVHCRYCFRRHYPYETSPARSGEWQSTIAAIAADESIHEVLLSGGDPLALVDDTLAALAQQLAEIPHLRRLRVHTRLPIVIPHRVTEELLEWLTGTRLTPIVVVHANHPQEIDTHVAVALSRLVDAGVPVLNQAVLLRGVNDSVESLVGLSERLVNLRVMPYYLHQLDRVQGAAHFEVPVETGRQLMAELHQQLPGYAVPRYVQEVAGEAYKVPLE